MRRECGKWGGFGGRSIERAPGRLDRPRERGVDRRARPRRRTPQPPRDGDPERREPREPREERRGHASEPAAKGPRHARADAEDHRVRVDLPHLHRAVEKRVVDAAVVDPRDPEDLPEPRLVRVLLDVPELLRELPLVQQIPVLHDPVAAEEEVARQDPVADDERAVLPVDAVAVGGVEEPDDQRVLRRAAERRVELRRRPEERRAAPAVVASAEEDRESRRRLAGPADVEAVDALRAERAKQVLAQQRARRVVHEPRAAVP